MNTSKKSNSLRQSVLEFCLKKYKTKPDYPWVKFSQHAVLRHNDTSKWYALIMEVPYKKLGISKEGNCNVLNVKCDPQFSGSLKLQEGFLPAYHMNKYSWLSILLDGTVPIEDITPLIELSFNLTEKKPVL